MPFLSKLSRTTESSARAPRRQALLALLALAALALHARGVRAEPGVMAYRYWDWGKTPKRDDYQVAVLTLALEKTVSSFGPFSVARVLDSLSTFRVRREVHEGKHLNVHVGPWRDLEAGDPQERNYLINTPILGGLLGYRRLIVRREDLAKFKAIANEAQLKKLMAGLGRGWVDATVLRHNGYQVEDSGNLATLLDMLLTKRFDYLPISVVEASSLLERHAQLASELALVPDLVLYYPLPAMFYVSASEPRLAQRLEAGMAAIKRDGSLDELTARHFQKEIQQLKTSSNRCFILTNPLLSKIYAPPPRFM
jgi:hypothetical protein